jgi:hypothetical protein
MDPQKDKGEHSQIGANAGTTGWMTPSATQGLPWPKKHPDLAPKSTLKPLATSR